MSKTIHGIFHVIWGGAQVAFVYAQTHPALIGLIPQPAGVIVSAAMAGISGAVAYWNHSKGK